MKPFKQPIDISADCSAIANLGYTWSQCWNGMLRGLRPFTIGKDLIPEWPDMPPVSAITNFGHFAGQPLFSARFAELVKCVGLDLKGAIDDLFAAHPGLRMSVLFASSAGDPGPLTAAVDAAFRKAGPSEPITQEINAGILGDIWNKPLAEALDRELPAMCIFGACASSLVATSYAAERINGGLTDAVLLIGIDTLSRVASVGFKQVGANSPEGARPYDKNRAGTTVGEGAVGILLARHGLLPSEKVAGCVVGAAVYCDAAHMVEPNPNGVAKAVTGALHQAQMTAGDICGVYWHGTGTRQNDKTEAAVASLVFGDKSPPSTSTKGSLGHTMGASGGFNLLAACETLATGIMPHVAGTTDPEYDNLDLVLGSPRAVTKGPMLITALGFGGINAAVVVVANQKEAR